jgi:hypothetical protein
MKARGERKFAQIVQQYCKNPTIWEEKKVTGYDTRHFGTTTKKNAKAPNVHFLSPKTNAL